MGLLKPFSAAGNTLRARLRASVRARGGGGDVPSRWFSPGYEERPKGFAFNRTPPPPGQSRRWEDWELPCYVTSFLTIVILGVGLSAKPDLTIETWAHQKALERLELEAAQLAVSRNNVFWNRLFGLNLGEFDVDQLEFMNLLI